MAPLHHHFQKKGIPEPKIVIPLLDYRYYSGGGDDCDAEDKVESKRLKG